MGRPSLDAEDRAQRRNVLLDVALALFRDTGELPTILQIAERAGVAKGAVYLSFRTKEEIFIALFEDQSSRLMDGLYRALPSGPIDPIAFAQQFSRSYTNAVTKAPDILALASMIHALLEKKLPIDSMVAFKHRLAVGLKTIGDRLESTMPQLKRGRGTALLLQTWAVTVGLWQSLDVPDELKKHWGKAESRIFGAPFPAELRAAVQALWIGGLFTGSVGAD